MREDEPQTRATSSMTMHAAAESAPCPPYSSGTWTALKPEALSASRASSREPLVLIDIRGVRLDLLLRQGADRGPELFVLLRRTVQVEVGVCHHQLLPVCSYSQCAGIGPSTW